MSEHERGHGELLRVDNIVRYLSGTMGLLSVVGALAVGLSFILFRDCRTFWRRMLLYLSIMDVCNAAYVLRFSIEPEVNNDAECLTDVAFVTFVNTSSFLWSACISFYPLYMLQVSYRKVQNLDAGAKVTRILHWIFCLISFGIPLLLMILVAAVYYPAHPLGPESLEGNIGCFIVFDADLWRLLAVYGPLLLCWVWALACFALGSQKLQARFARAFVGSRDDGDAAAAVVISAPAHAPPLLTTSSHSSATETQGRPTMATLPSLASTSTDDDRGCNGRTLQARQRVRDSARSETLLRTRTLRWKMRLFPLCFVVLRLGEVLYRLMLRTDSTNSAIKNPDGTYTTLGMILVYWFAIGAPAQGFANFILFVVMSPRVRLRYTELLCPRSVWPPTLTHDLYTRSASCASTGVMSPMFYSPLPDTADDEERLSENSRQI